MALIKLNNNSISAVSALPSGIDTGKVGQVVQQQSSTKVATTSQVLLILVYCSNNS
jgi:Lhr-like helicase